MKVHRFAWWPVATTMLQPRAQSQLVAAPGEEREAELKEPMAHDAEVEDDDGV